MEIHSGETQAASSVGTLQSHEWLRHVIGLLEVAMEQLHERRTAQDAIAKATSLLRQQIEPQSAESVLEGGARLLGWQARRVCDYINAHISSRVSVADLCALLNLSEAHFARAFKRTFGRSPYAFVVRRRVELATQCMLQTGASLSDIALRCGFVDQAHLCKHFRQATGRSPAAWRRAVTADSQSRARLNGN